MKTLAKAVLLTAGILATHTTTSASATMLQGSATVNDSYAAAAAGAQRSLSPYKLNAQAGRNPADYQGTWACVSRVVSSNVRAVVPGQTMACNVNFQINPSGQLLVSWQQDGWDPSQCSVVNFSPTHSQIVHKNTPSTHSSWTALARDWLHMQSSNQMQGRSKVIQYQNGQAIGSYETASVLTRI
ncbi:MAG TPA: hypothetical protein V6C81_22195 [Planktothrix sp.]|jgi:hypothetical protein